MAPSSALLAHKENEQLEMGFMCWHHCIHSPCCAGHFYDRALSQWMAVPDYWNLEDVHVGDVGMFDYYGGSVN